MKKHFELVIVGGGPAGITLAKKLGRIYHTAVIRPEPYSMIYCAMPYAVEGIIEKEKTFKNDSLITESGAELIRDKAESINDKENFVTLKSGEKISYEKLVIVTGAEPFLPPVPGSKLKGVYVFKTQNDLEKLESMKSTLKKIAVIGAGAIGIEAAQAFNAIGVETTLIDMGKSVLPNMIDEDMSMEAVSELTAKGIKLHLDRKVVEIKGKEHCESVILDNGFEINLKNDINCNIDDEPGKSGAVLFVAGVKPSVELADGTRIKSGRDGIIVNEYMETSVKNIYACGDCASYVSGITGKPSGGKLATNAVPMAKVLADNLKGVKRPYTGFFNGAATKVGNHYVGSTGLSEKDAKREGYDVVTAVSEITTKFPIMPGAVKLKTKLVADKKSGRLIGGQIVSKEPVAARIDVLTMALQNKMTVKDLVEHSYCAQPYQSFYPAENGMVMASEKLFENMEKENN
ncbi:MAG: FAD-dependent oxidoreductase [Candidatus Goldbacteria bacterium]|nr:FAD-dependent oxidoreductase [Candidatus Goldiibacteriota bacterium]